MVLDERPLSELFGHASGESSDGLVQLAATLRQLTALVAAEEAPSELQSAWRQVATILKEASCKVADLLAVASSAQSESGPAQAEKLLHELLQSWNRQLLALPKGGCALLPLAWTASSRAPRTAALAVLRREGDKGAFALLNLAGSGAEYHLRQLRGPLTRPRLCCCPVVAKAPWSRLCSSPFWLFMLRPVLGLQEDPHPALLYEALLPFLTKEERSAQLNRQMSYDWGVRWCPVPRSDDTKIHVVFEALALALQSSQPPAVAEWVLLLLRWRALKASPTASWEMCQALARRAAEVGEAPLPDPLPRWNPPEILEQLYAWLSSKMPEETAGRLPALANFQADADSLTHSGFQWLGQEDVVSEEPERPALVLPVPLVLVSCDTVQDYHLAAVALRSCVRGCALLLNQRGLVANADRHVVALVQHLFYEVLPMPLPPSRGVSACFWRSMPMYYEAQASLVREIWLLVQYFLAASLSLPLNTHHHSVRLLTLCSALAILDAVLRRLPPHTQNDLSRVYSGVLRSSSKASAFAVTAQLAQSTEELPLSDPRAQELRSGLLDYFAGAGESRAAGRKARRIFEFTNMRLGAGDLELLQRLALLRGCVQGSCPESRLARYLTGEVPELLSAFPGLMVLRDMSFLVRLLCVKITSASDLRRSDGKPWNTLDLMLRWEYDAEEGRLRVQGLQRALVPGELSVPAGDKPETASFFSRLGRTVTSLWTSQVQEPVLLSAAEASNLAGQSIHTEDDVLHTPELPNFEAKLSQADSELLLSFLTVPYLRVPLLLQFFNDRSRFAALCCPRLQAMLDAVLFEPGFFEEENESAQCPEVVYPGLSGSEGQKLLATPAGRFVHELVHSPTPVLAELDGIFRLAMERDVPQYTSASSAVLYAVRLWTRATAYAGLVAARSLEGAAEASTRGLGSASTETARLLEERAQLWQSRLLLEAVPMLERWCSRAMASGELQVACILWLHLALIQRWRKGEANKNSVSTLLCSELFLNANLDTSGLGTRRQAEELGLLDTEIFELFHSTRSRVYRWLQKSSPDGTERDAVLEHVVSTVASSPAREVAMRRWWELEDSWDGRGRFAASPSAPLPAAEVDPDEDFARWLSASVASAPVEVNVNLGQLQFRQHSVTVVPREVLALPEFQEVFPQVDVNACLLWALVERAPSRERYRFAGLRYEFRLWKLPDEPVLRMEAFSRKFPEHATVAEEWLSNAIAAVPEMQPLWTRGKWLAPEEVQRRVCKSAKLALSFGADSAVEPEAFHYEDGYSASPEASTEKPQLFEVEVFPNGPNGPVVHLYSLSRYGPRVGRTQIFSSDTSWSLSASQELSPELLSPRPPRSLEIVHEDLSGESTLVPRRLLRGKLPDALLEPYEFWRGRRVVGKLKQEHRCGAGTAVVLELTEDQARVQRVCLESNRKDEEKQLDQLLHAPSLAPKGDALVDLLRKSETWAVAEWLLQLEDLSHILAWAQVTDSAGSMSRVELPRLGLSFTGEKGQMRCDQHGGLKVVGQRSFHNEPGLRRLVKPFQRFVLLEDENGELFLLSSLADRPRKTQDAIRGDATWLRDLRLDMRHQLFRLHAGELLIAASLLAELHLMLLRICRKMFCEACSGVLACTASGLPQQPEECLLWEEITSALRGESCMGAAVLRLKLVLQLHRQGQGIPEAWNPEADFLFWANHGWDSVAGHLLTLEEDAALLDLLSGSDEANWQLRARCTVHRQLLELSAARGHVSWAQRATAGHVVTLQLSDGPGPAERGKLALGAVSAAPLLAALDAPNDPSAPWLGQQDEPGTAKQGVLAMSALLRCLPLRLSQDFLLLYELLVGARTVWLLPTDDPNLTGELLARLVAPKELAEHPALAALLRMLEEKPAWIDRLPRKCGPDFGQQLLAALTAHREMLQLSPSSPSLPSSLAFERQADGSWQQTTALGATKDVVQDSSGVPLTNDALLAAMRVMGSFGDRRWPSMTWDFDCRSRSLQLDPAGTEAFWQVCKELHERWPSLAFPQLESLASKPLTALGLGSLLKTVEGSGEVKDVASLRALCVQEGPCGKSSAGRALLNRLEWDFRHLAQLKEISFHGITAASSSSVLQDSAQLKDLEGTAGNLAEALKCTVTEDMDAMYKAIDAALTLANPKLQRGSCQKLAAGLRSFAEPALHFQDVLHLLLISGGLEQVLPHLRPTMEAKDIRDLGAATVLAMLLAGRVLLCRQSLAALTRLQSLARRLNTHEDKVKDRRKSWSQWGSTALKRLSGTFKREDDEQEEHPASSELLEAAQDAASALSGSVNSMEGMRYDSRLMIFEFINRLVLRKKQVDLVRQMQTAVEGRKPLVHQMLMGEGKTTVVTPLVILLNGSAQRACIVCVPAALTEFTRKVLQERLCATLARPVLEFKINRATPVSDDHFFKLLHAQDARAVLCSGPTALKSLLLRFVLTLHAMDLNRSKEQETEERVKGSSLLSPTSWKSLLGWPGSSARGQQDVALQFEARALGWALDVFRGAVLLLDDIDLLMHPLRSELHWPLGALHQLDFTHSVEVAQQEPGISYVAGSPVGARWQLAFHLLDGFFSCQLEPGPAVSSFQGEAARRVQRRLSDAVQRGLRLKHLQQAPHLVLLSPDFYHKELRPVLADWALLWLRRAPLPEEPKLRRFLCADAEAEEGLQALSDGQLKAVHLARTWLATLFPHLASRIHRVHYGLLDEASPSWAAEARPRRLLAVPFVGKDAPSDSSQFSHPDVLIGLTWLAYRFAGLRPGDFRRALRSLTRKRREDDRAGKLWAAWITKAGGHVRGELLDTSQASENKCLVLARDHTDPSSKLVPPLEWLDSSDTAQMTMVFEVLQTSPFLMEFYLHELLPQLLRHSDAKLSANGQDLGGEALCSSRLGFSGTPNDLLPQSLGRCKYAPGDDAKMLSTLSDPLVVEVTDLEDGWSAQSLLKLVALHRPPLNALIDVGALITGLSNHQVATTLLDYGLPFEAVVYLDRGGSAQLVRRGLPPVLLSNCTLPPARRFVFYDQVHTTGIDIRHCAQAQAALTLGKDSTFRDFAQGAYRLRGIGKGQGLKVLLTPEVSARVNEEVIIPAMNAGGVRRAASHSGATGHAELALPSSPRRGSAESGIGQVSLLDRVCAWLVVRQAAAEQTQRQLLARQSVQYQGRRCAYESLMAQLRGKEGALESHSLLDLFRERVDYTVEASLQSCSLRELAESVTFALDAQGKEVVRSIFTADASLCRRGEEEQALFAEMEQEHEQELFAEQEEEKEQEQEEEEEEEVNEDSPPSQGGWQKLARDPPQSPWSLALLAEPSEATFRPAKAMALNSNRGSEVANFPTELWFTQNFYRGGEKTRLRWPVAVLEWMPAERDPEPHGGRVVQEKSGGSSPSRRTRLTLALELQGLLGKASICAREVKALLASLGVPNAKPHEVDTVLEAIVEQAADDACHYDCDDYDQHSPSNTPTSATRMLRKALSPTTVAKALQRCHAVEAQPGRFYALLSLGEAEGLRAIMHRRKLPGCEAALRVLRREPLGLSLLDTTSNYQAAPFGWHEARLAQCLAFLGAETHYAPPVLESLWQQFRVRAPPIMLQTTAAQASGGSALRDFFEASLTCRRCFMPDGAWRESPAAQLFAEPRLMAQRRREATVREAYRALLDSGILPEAAFKKLDADQDDELRPDDFATNLVQLSPELLLRLFETLDTANRGSISLEEWTAAFEIAGPRPVAAASGEPLPPPEALPLDVLRRIVIELVPHTTFKPLWTSEGMLCRKHVSIWAPDQLVKGLMGVTALKVSLGHYANRGFADARGSGSGAGRRLILQVRDRRAFLNSSDEYLRAVADHYCPCPVKYRQVWSQLRGRPLYLWRPVPPNEAFVCLGMVATTSPEAPPLDALRCVPKSFCRPCTQAPVQLWDDSGSGGKPASIWLVNAPQVLWASVGHNPPSEIFWELAAESISFDYTGRPSLHVVHETGEAQAAAPNEEVDSSWSIASFFSSRRRSM